MSNSEPLKPNSQPNLREILDDGIIHFDATGARREAMRRAATNRIESSSNNASKNGSAHVVSNSNEHRNGNGQLHAAAAQPVAPPIAQSAPLSRIAPESTIPAAGTKNQSGVSSWKERVQSAIGISSQTAHTPKTSPQPTPIQSAPAALPAPVVSQSPVAPTISEPPKVTTPPNAIQSESTPSASIALSHNGSQISRDQIRHFLVDFVMEQTGYPEDIVSVDADLEADLGIDSIKIAQMIGEVIEHFGLDAKALQRTSADNYKTLNTIIDTIASLSGTNVGDSSAAQPSTTTSPPKEPLAVAPVASHIAEEPCAPELAGSEERRQVMTKFLIDFVIEQTGYPEDIVSLDSDLEADLGIDSIKIAQMVGELNDYFHLNVAALRTKTAADFKTISTIIDAVLSVESPQDSQNETGARTPQKSLNSLENSRQPTPASIATPIATPAPTMPAPQVSTIATTAVTSTGKSLNAHDLQSFLTAFVVEQTGYPEDIVTLDADLEADLGIDSIKIAQMMGEMNDHFGLTIKDYDGRTMDDFKSLGAIISHLTK